MQGIYEDIERVTSPNELWELEVLVSQFEAQIRKARELIDAKSRELTQSKTETKYESDYEELAAVIKELGYLPRDGELRERIRQKLTNTITSKRGDENSYSLAELKQFASYHGLAKQGTRAQLARNILASI
jgi:hypothetical protein